MSLSAWGPQAVVMEHDDFAWSFDYCTNQRPRRIGSPAIRTLGTEQRLA